MSVEGLRVCQDRGAVESGEEGNAGGLRDLHIQEHVRIRSPLLDHLGHGRHRSCEWGSWHLHG